jgi:hypothetical protein
VPGEDARAARSTSWGTSGAEYRVTILQLDSKTTALMLLFAFYLISIIMFGFVYWRMFSVNPTAFAFNADILRRQAAAFRTVATRKLATDQEALALLAQATLHLQRHAVVPQRQKGGEWVADLGGIRLTTERNVVVVYTGAHAVNHRVSLDAASGKKCASTFYQPNFDPEDLPGVFRSWSGKLEAQVKATSRRLVSIDTDGPEVWSFVDFLYFSAMTQTTVGYGDILPNSSRVRALVCVQILVASLMLIVVINVILAGGA